tara:strand:- start:108 stop:305 length:198 start_codon:yes stop_codon:yes gene_type:complete
VFHAKQLLVKRDGISPPTMHGGKRGRFSSKISTRNKFFTDQKLPIVRSVIFFLGNAEISGNISPC